MIFLILERDGALHKALQAPGAQVAKPWPGQGWLAGVPRLRGYRMWQVFAPLLFPLDVHLVCDCHLWPGSPAVLQGYCWGPLPLTPPLTSPLTSTLTSPHTGNSVVFSPSSSLTGHLSTPEPSEKCFLPRLCLAAAHCPSTPHPALPSPLFYTEFQGHLTTLIIHWPPCQEASSIHQEQKR